MSTIKVDTIATRTGSGNITLSNSLASATVAGDLTVDTSTLKVDSSNNKVGIGLTAPQELLHIKDGSIAVGNGTASNNSLVGKIGFSTDSSNSRFIGIECFRGSDAANADLRFHTFGGDSDSGERMRIHTNGVVSCADGIALGVGTANTTANVLDDYEEGSWTPTVQNATGYSAQFGRYFKVGHLCFINANVTTTGASGATNVISSLPFASANTGNSAGNLSIGYYSGVNTPMVWLSGYVLNNSTNIYISGNSAGHTGETIQHNGASMFKTSASSRIMFSAVYHVA